MKVTIIGISRRNSQDKDGKKIVYSTIYYTESFDEYTRTSQVCLGEKCGAVSTSLSTEEFAVGDEINLDYAPSGFTSKDGTPQFRLQSIDMIAPFKKVDKK